MQEDPLSDLIAYPSSIKIIDNIKITEREIDIIACVINRRVSDTSISELLRINKRTVETHIRNITQKFSCTTRQLREVVDHAGKSGFFLQHYQTLVHLKKTQGLSDQIKPLIHKHSMPARLFYMDDTLQPLLNKICFYLTDLGMAVSMDLINSTDSELNKHDQTQYFLIVNNKDKSADLERFAGICLNILEYPTIFDFIFAIIKKSTQDEKIASLLEKFNSKSGSYLVNSTVSDLSFSSGGVHTDIKKISHLFNSRSIQVVLLGALFIIVSLIAVWWVIREPLSPRVNIRSELSLPKPSLLLPRTQLQDTIQKALYSSSLKDSIPTVAICGIGGSGKTTIARIIGRQHTGIVWELNAETETALKTSMHNLAYTLAQTSEDRARLNFVFNLSNAKQQDRQICLFVSTKLAINPGWLLVFDNVESFEKIKDYFPTDPTVWGVGHILITSRDSNFQYIEPDSVIMLDALSKEERIKLFTQTRYNHATVQDDDNKSLNGFLEKIPAFPLDIVVAANFLQQSDLSYEQYLEYLTDNASHSDRPGLLKKRGEYKQTRKDIISVSLNPLLTNKNYIELLVLIAFIDSQNIPIAVLKTVGGDIAADKLIYELRKYSLISVDAADDGKKVLSMHRSIQSNLCQHLFEVLNINKIHSALEKALKTFEMYVNELVETSNYKEISRLLPHAENLTKHTKLPEHLIGIINVSYANLLSIIPSHSVQIVPLLEKSLNTLKMVSTKDTQGLLRYARALSILGDRQRSSCLFSKAYTSLEESVSIFQRLAPESIDASKAYVRLGTLYRVQGHHKKAHTFFLKALEIYKKHPDEYHPLDKLVALGLNERDIGNYKQSINYLEQNLNQMKDKNNSYYFLTLSYLGTVYLDTGLYEKAWNCFQTAEEFTQKQSKGEGVPYAWSLAYMGATKALQGFPKEALAMLEKSYQAFNKISAGKEMHGICFKVVLPYMGHTYVQQREFKKAYQVYNQSLTLLEKHYGRGHLQTARVIYYLGILALKENRLKDAENFLQTAYKIFKQNNHTDAFLTLEGLSDLLYDKSAQSHKRGLIHEAEQYKHHAKEYLNHALAIVNAEMPKDSEHIQRIHAKLR